ncbi:glycosyltransferase family 2 protein [Aquirufa nivalisilvae]|uniref:Glycosyltransferase EpsE n=1 Tax=Aquirufa nivalisilvae TaxID=2516557 RepID=A0A2S2DRW7_9BACT|nr:glycosyltransferase family 2 protein [Aquirufa nivalisilvae]AWL08134.1 Putative glycosyltransferase EpsE [Aquirufa nivalisilvae]MCZ2481364.1 glycosyltransferase family 2 protein [Aquirufa nivalisilvae]
MPHISVALCTYNGEKYLPYQLESIASQTQAIHELVVFDDGSSDKSIEILEAFKQKVPFQVHIHQNEKNVGSSKNFEMCVQACSGDLIFFSDQDDLWLPHKVETLVRYFENYPEIDAVFSNAIMIDRSGKPTGKTSFEQIEFIEPLQELWKAGNSFDILLKGYVVTGATLAIRSQVKKEVFPTPHIIPELIHDGWIALYLSMTNRIAFVKEPLIQYREHDSQQVGLKSEKKAVSLLDRFKRSRKAKLVQIEKKATDSSALYNYLKASGKAPENALEKVASRMLHYQMRAKLANNRLLRIWPVLKGVLQGGYKLHDGGKWWHPVLGDIIE